MSLIRSIRGLQRVPMLALAAALFSPASARADAVTEWNERACEIIGASGLRTPPANRVMAIAHTAAFEAANAITRRYPSTGTAANLEAPRGASVEAAIAAAHRTAFGRLLPAQHQTVIDAAYQKALAAIASGAAKDAGIALGERAAQEVLARRADDGAAASEAYRPLAPPGRWVPTSVPLTPQWPQRTPWLMTSASQFRPGPPPALASERWARDYNEVRLLGAAVSTQRSSEQGAIARFWEATLPAIYHGAVRSVAEQPGRDLMRNARLFAALTQAIDDAFIAVFEAKYHYALWRPVTAIRNGDQDGNDATEREPSWTPLIDTPVHPEYPCAHCIQAGVIGAFLRHEIGSGAPPVIATKSSSAGGAERRWTSVEALVQEVMSARIYGGMHYRTSTEVGAEMGRRIGALALQQLLSD
jgi:PAP2 superfamily